MILTIRELRNLIREGVFVRSVPEHQFDSATHEYVEQIKKLLTTYVIQNRSKSPEERMLAFKDLDRVMQVLEQEVDQKLQDVLNDLISSE